jgi:hypothetical protein
VVPEHNSKDVTWYKWDENEMHAVHVSVESVRLQRAAHVSVQLKACFKEHRLFDAACLHTQSLAQAVPGSCGRQATVLRLHLSHV